MNYQPETEALWWATHNNIRKTLFFALFRSIKYVEYKRLVDDRDGFTLDKVTESKESLIDKFLDTYWGKEMQRGKLMQVSLWQMKREI